MKTKSIVLLSIGSSITASVIITFVTLSILGDLDTEFRRLQSFTDITEKTHALQVLAASFKEKPVRSDFIQAKKVLQSLDDLLNMPSREPRERVLIEQLQKSHRELGPLIDQWFASGGAENSEDSIQRNIFVFQTRLKVQFIAEDTMRLQDISRSRIITAQKKTTTLIVSLIALLAVTIGTIYWFSIRSIVRAQRALLESQERLRLAQEAAQVGIWDWNLTTGRIEWTPQMERIYGYEPGTFPSNYSGFREHVHPKDLAEVERQLNAAVGAHQSFDFDFRVCPSSSEIRWVNCKGVAAYDRDGRPQRVFGVNVDTTQRKQVEEALRESEQRYRSIIETAEEGIATHNPDGTITYVNQRMADMLGYSREEMIGRSSLDFVDDDAKEAVIRARESLRERENFSNERKLRRKDGSILWTLGNVSRRYDSTGNQIGYLAMHTDITDRKQAELALREKEARLQLAQTFGRVGVWDWHPRTGEINFSEEMNRIYGLSPGTIKTYQDWLSRVYLDDVALMVSERDAALAKREPFNLEFRIIHSSGEIRWVTSRGRATYDEAGQIERVVGINFDISELKQAEEELKRSQSLLKAIIETIPDPVYAKDVQSRLVMLNPAALKVVGKPEEEILGHDDREFYDDPAVGDVILANDQRVMAAGVAEAFEEKLLTPAGYRYFLDTKVPWRDTEGRVIGIIGVSRDITEQKLAKERLQDSLREKEVLLKEVHHRVKNNLQIISSLVDLQVDALKNPDLDDAFLDIRNRIRSMALVHEQLYQSDNLARVDFAEYAQCLVNYLWRAQDRFTTHIQLKTDLQPVWLTTDQAVPCGLILNELVTNIFKYAFHGRAEGEVHLSLFMGQENRVYLRLGDNGVGLPANVDWQQPQSLGLRLLQMLVRQLKGKVELSRTGGTEFTISFKAHQQMLLEKETP